MLILGLLQCGFVVNLLPHAVISGFTSAAGVIIALTQVGKLFGLAGNIVINTNTTKLINKTVENVTTLVNVTVPSVTENKISVKGDTVIVWFESLVSFIDSRVAVNLGDLAIGVSSLVFLFVCRYLTRKYEKLRPVPIPLLLVVIVTGLSAALGWGEHGVSVTGV